MMPDTLSAPLWTSFAVPTFNGALDTHIETGEDYPSLTLGDLFTMQPASKAKGSSPAFIPSLYLDYDARNHLQQRLHGQFVALTCDIDKGDHTPARVLKAVKAFAGEAAHLIYSSAHAKPGDMRWRVILPLEAPCGFEAWYDAQCAFYAFMEAHGIECDHALARAAQPVYLPNVPAVHAKTETPLRDDDGKALYYKAKASALTAPGLSLQSGPVSEGIAALQQRRIADNAERERIRKEAEQRRANKPRGDGASLMDDFNASNSVATMLEICGYEQCPRNPEDWRSPHQTGETYATRVIGSKWVSLSQSDASAGLGETCKSGCYGDAYDLFVHYKHGGDHKAAYRQLGAEQRGNNVVQFPTPEPPEWMADIPAYDAPPEWADMDGEPVVDIPEAEPDATDTFEYLTLGELRKLPPPEWLIHETIVSDGLSIIYGEPGAGKSFIAIDMALRLAIGADWHGVKTQRAGILYIAGEGVRGIGKRVEGWARFHNVDVDALPFVVVPVAAQILDPGDRAKLIRTIDAVKARLSFDVTLTIVDTVSRSIAGQDENGQETMSAFVRACDDIKAYTGGAMIGIHHSGKEKERGMRGSTVLLGACDASIRLSKSERTVTMDFEKQKDAEEQEPIYFELERFEWEEEGLDDRLSTLVPKRSDTPGDGLESINRDQIRQAFAALADAWGDRNPLSHRPETRKDGRFAPSILSKRFGGDADAWAKLIAHWLENGNLSFEMYDKTRKTRGLMVKDAVL